jgi:intracellular multiplication protein IcmJ
MNRTANQPVFGVKRKFWRKDDDHADIKDAGFTKVRAEVFQRDNYTCRFCGFKAAKYQEIHHIDDNHQNNDPQNLLTVCNLCHQVHHLGMCAMRNGGFIAAIPELTQTEVNNIVRAIHVAEYIADAAVRDKLKSLFAIFQFRGKDTLKTLYGGDISNPYILAEIISTCPDDIYAKRAELLAPLRLVASKEAFHAGQLEYYAANNRALFLPESWPPLTHQLLM